MSFRLLPWTPENDHEIAVERAAGFPTKETLLLQQHGLTAETLLHRVAAVTPAGRLVGYGLAVAGPWDPTLKPRHFLIEVRVEPDWRRQGVGGSIYREVERFALEHRAVAMEASVSDSAPANLAWAERRGFVNRQHMFASELDLGAFDPAPFAGVVDAVRARGIGFTSLAAYSPIDEWFARFADLYWELIEDVPGMGGRTPPKLADWKQTFEQVWDPAGVIFAVDGDRWAALAVNIRLPDGSYYNNMTGVRKEYRGQGLGLAVKLVAIEYARSTGARNMRTHNDSTNQPMLAVNTRLGFRPQGGTFWLVRSL